MAGSCENDVAIKHEEKGSDSSGKKVFIPRHIGLLGVIAHTVGAVIGTGIFISPTGVLRGAGGSVGLAFIFWIVCGIIQTCGCFIYTELALMFRKSGGEFTFMLEGWGRAVGFLKLWTIVMVNASSVAIQAHVVSQYLLTPFFQCVDPPVISLRFISFCAILVLVFVNCVSANLPTRFAGFFTVTKTFGLLMVIMTGIHNLIQGRTIYLQNAFEGSSVDVKTIPLAIYSGMFAFGGWDVVMSFTEEVKRPERNIPLGVSLSMATITILYIMANIAYFTLLSPQDVLQSEAVAADYSVLALGRWSWLIWLFVALSAMGNLNSNTCKRGRQVFAASREGLFPEITAMLNVRYNTPIPAILTLLLSLVYLMETRVLSLLRYVMFIETIFDTMTVAVLPYFRWKHPDLERPFRAPLVMVVIYMVGQIFITGMSFYLDPVRKSLGLFIVLIGLPVYFFFFHERFRLKSIQPYSHKMTRFLQRLFNCIHQEKKTY
ncbi:Y+L amino acid transporter 2-like [Lytechinus pictus]|uniref:Y+L amino acid transporter 2-like n=1 Tax=Lytechinus pictus TaxID=7653 RepID=UPI0030B9D8C6